MSSATTVDRNGRPVAVGTRVRIVELAASLRASVPCAELDDLESMVGETFAVYEIDDHGAAWVEKTWPEAGERSRSHSIGLAPHEMEIV